MTTFEELKQAYERNPQEVFDLIAKMEVPERTVLLLNSISEGKRSNKVADGEKNLPAAYRKVGVRWAHFGNLLTFEQKMLVRHIEPHIQLEKEGSDYIANTLALLVWKSVAEPEAPSLR